MMNDPMRYQIAFLQRLTSPANDLRKYINAINLSWHNNRVAENRVMIRHVERYREMREMREHLAAEKAAKEVT